jgi:hypothetical protein
MNRLHSPTSTGTKVDQSPTHLSWPPNFKTVLLDPLRALLLSFCRGLQHAVLLKHGLEVVSDFQRGHVLTGNL